MIKKCPICNNELVSEGNNASPINISNVCNECNMNVVIPYRIYLSNKIKDRAMVVSPEGFIKLVKPESKHFTLEELQSIVGGLIELYPHRINVDIIICNDKGSIKNMPYNNLIKLLFDIDLVGTVIVSPTNLDEYDE